MERAGQEPREESSMSGHGIWTTDARVAVRLAVSRDVQQAAKKTPPAETESRGVGLAGEPVTPAPTSLDSAAKQAAPKGTPPAHAARQQTEVVELSLPSIRTRAAGDDGSDPAAQPWTLLSASPGVVLSPAVGRPEEDSRAASATQLAVSGGSPVSVQYLTALQALVRQTSSPQHGDGRGRQSEAFSSFAGAFLAAGRSRGGQSLAGAQHSQPGAGLRADAGRSFGDQPLEDLFRSGSFLAGGSFAAMNPDDMLSTYMSVMGGLPSAGMDWQAMGALMDQQIAPPSPRPSLLSMPLFMPSGNGAAGGTGATDFAKSQPEDRSSEARERGAGRALPSAMRTGGVDSASGSAHMVRRSALAPATSSPRSPLTVQPASSMDRFLHGMHDARNNLILLPTMRSVRQFTPLTPPGGTGRPAHEAARGGNALAQNPRLGVHSAPTPHFNPPQEPASPLFAYAQRLGQTVFSMPTERAVFSASAAERTRYSSDPEYVPDQVQRCPPGRQLAASGPSLRAGPSSMALGTAQGSVRSSSQATDGSRWTAAALAGGRPSLAGEEVQCARPDALQRLDDVPLCTRRKVSTASSKLRGVTRHKITGRFEAQLWDPTQVNPPAKPGTKSKRPRGRQVYLGGYETEEEAARAYDRAALKFFGQNQAKLNFDAAIYNDDVGLRSAMTRDEWVAHIRSGSQAFARGRSKYRGVTHHHQGNWEARISQAQNTRYIYLGTFADEVLAARAYDLACIVTKGQRAVLNFPTTDYMDLKTGELKEDLPWAIPQGVLNRARASETGSEGGDTGKGPRKRARVAKQ